MHHCTQKRYAHSSLSAHSFSEPIQFTYRLAICTNHFGRLLCLARLCVCKTDKEFADVYVSAVTDPFVRIHINIYLISIPINSCVCRHTHTHTPISLHTHTHIECVLQNCVADISNMPCHAKHNQMGCVLYSCSRVFSLCTLCAKIAIVCANVSKRQQQCCGVAFCTVPFYHTGVPKKRV